MLNGFLAGEQGPSLNTERLNGTVCSLWITAKSLSSNLTISRRATAFASLSSECTGNAWRAAWAASKGMYTRYIGTLFAGTQWWLAACSLRELVPIVNVSAFSLVPSCVGGTDAAETEEDAMIACIVDGYEFCLGACVRCVSRRGLRDCLI